MYVICGLDFCFLFAGEGGGKIFLRARHYPGKHSSGEPVAAALLGAGKGRCSENESKRWICFQFRKLKAAQLEDNCSVIQVICSYPGKENSRDYFIKAATASLLHSTFCFHADPLDTVECGLFLCSCSQVLYNEWTWARRKVGRSLAFLEVRKEPFFKQSFHFFSFPYKMNFSKSFSRSFIVSC